MPVRHRPIWLTAAAVMLAMACASSTRRSALVTRSELFWSQPPELIKLSFTRDLLASIEKQRDAWKADEIRTHGEVTPSFSGRRDREQQRLVMMHCHVDGSYDANGILSGKTKPYAVPTIIASENQAIGVCPNWPFLTDSLHKRRASQERENARKPFPDSLITGLDSARLANPNDAWYLRQVVRVLTENGDYKRARAVIDTCADDLWCEALDGYLEYVQGHWQQASAAWASALTGMDASRRCDVLSTGQLIVINRDALGFHSCADRAWFDQNVWWMSKPLFSDSINYRLLEHLARVVRSAMATDLPRDVHYDLRPAAGGDAVTRMWLRYGWPTHMYWPGQKQDDGHQDYVRGKATPFPLPPYASPEYSREVVSTTPTMFAAQLPFTAKEGDFAVDHELDYSDARPWPQEFFRHPNGVLLRIRTQQHALLRRDSASLFVAAITMPVPPKTTEPDSSIRLQLLTSSNPTDVKQVATARTRWGGRAFLTGELRRPAVIGLEVNRGGGRIAGARMRFGVPTTPSHVASPKSCALSDPILLDPAVLAGAETEKLQRGMLSDLALRRPQKIGLLWESYGVRAGDSVAISVRVTGSQDRGGLARAVQSLGIVGQQEVAVAVSWKEPSPARRVEVIPAVVPTLQRDLMLDIASLRSGTYAVQVTMTAAGCEATSPVRQFSVTR